MPINSNETGSMSILCNIAAGLFIAIVVIAIIVFLIWAWKYITWFSRVMYNLMKKPKRPNLNGIEVDETSSTIRVPITTLAGKGEIDLMVMRIPERYNIVIFGFTDNEMTLETAKKSIDTAEKVNIYTEKQNNSTFVIGLHSTPNLTPNDFKVFLFEFENTDKGDDKIYALCKEDEEINLVNLLDIARKSDDGNELEVM